jgi:tripartite-type tricarboxylate transporter receptor subunit TctC
MIALPLRALGALMVALAAGVACAQEFPKGPITLIIPLAPGDATDVAGRTMGDELSRLLKVPVVVVNRPGAGGSLAADSVVRAGKDGYTILLSQNGALTFRRVLEPQAVSYDPSRDLTALGLATRTPSVLAIRTDAPFDSFAVMVDYAKKNPGKVRIGTAGPGSVGDFCVQIMSALTGAELTMVPFKGAAPAVAALRGGHIEAVVLALGALGSQMKSGALRGIAISTRFPSHPEIPTLGELGYSQDLLGVWLAFFAPGGLPPEVTGTLVPAIEKTVRNEGLAAKLLPFGMVQEYAAPEALRSEIRNEQRRVEELARKVGLIR